MVTTILSFLGVMFVFAVGAALLFFGALGDSVVVYFSGIIVLILSVLLAMFGVFG